MDTKALYDAREQYERDCRDIALEETMTPAEHHRRDAQEEADYRGYRLDDPTDADYQHDADADTFC